MATSKEPCETLSAYEVESRLAYFDKMIADLASGQFRRTTFQPWEVEVLLDIQSVNLGEANRKALLRRYQRAAHRWFERGGRTLLRMSDYLAKRHRRAPVNGGFAPQSAPLEDEAGEGT
jgi:hypothetical protein